MRHMPFENYSDSMFARAVELGCWPVPARAVRTGWAGIDATMPWKCGCRDYRHNGDEGIINLAALHRAERATQ